MMRSSPSSSTSVPLGRPLPRRRWIALAVATLGFLGGGTAAAQTTGAITGRVTEGATGLPLTAAVRVMGTQIGAQSGSDGKYTIRGVAPGTIDLAVTHIGY